MRHRLVSIALMNATTAELKIASRSKIRYLGALSCWVDANQYHYKPEERKGRSEVERAGPVRESNGVMPGTDGDSALSVLGAENRCGFLVDFNPPARSIGVGEDHVACLRCLELQLNGFRLVASDSNRGKCGSISIR